jgi:hypothetical protein
MDDSTQSLVMWTLPLRGIGYGGDDFSRHSSSFGRLVSCRLAVDQLEERHQRLGPTARSGAGKLQDCMGNVAQIAPCNGCPESDKLSGIVEVDETYWGAEEHGAIGRLTESKTLIAVAVEEDGRGIGRIRLRTIQDLQRATLHGYIAASIGPAG